jgi:DNA-binding CsgD family transcriptional regulator
MTKKANATEKLAARDQKIIQGLRDHKTCQSLAHKYHLSRQRVYQIGVENGITEFLGEQTRWERLADRRKQIAEYVGAVHTQKEAALRFKCTKDSVYKACRDMNVTAPAEVRIISRPTRILNILGDSFDRGLSVGEIANRNNTTASAVTMMIHRARQAGVPVPYRKALPVTSVPAQD